MRKLNFALKTSESERSDAWILLLGSTSTVAIFTSRSDLRARTDTSLVASCDHQSASFEAAAIPSDGGAALDSSLLLEVTMRPPCQAFLGLRPGDKTPATGQGDPVAGGLENRYRELTFPNREATGARRNGRLAAHAAPMTARDRTNIQKPNQLDA